MPKHYYQWVIFSRFTSAPAPFCNWLRFSVAIGIVQYCTDIIGIHSIKYTVLNSKVLYGVIWVLSLKVTGGKEGIFSHSEDGFSPPQLNTGILLQTSAGWDMAIWCCQCPQDNGSTWLPGSLSTGLSAGWEVDMTCLWVPVSLQSYQPPSILWGSLSVSRFQMFSKLCDQLTRLKDHLQQLLMQLPTQGGTGKALGRSVFSFLVGLL